MVLLGGLQEPTQSDKVIWRYAVAVSVKNAGEILGGRKASLGSGDNIVCRWTAFLNRVEPQNEFGTGVSLRGGLG